jgi:hypothetical protein
MSENDLSLPSQCLTRKNEFPLSTRVVSDVIQKVPCSLYRTQLVLIVQSFPCPHYNAGKYSFMKSTFIQCLYRTYSYTYSYTCIIMK